MDKNDDQGKKSELDTKPLPGRTYLELLLNKPMRIEISDGRTLIGQFLCTDHDENIILGSCQEFIGSPDEENTEEPRLLGLAMIPGRHVKNMHLDMDDKTREDLSLIMSKQDHVATESVDQVKE